MLPNTRYFRPRERSHATSTQSRVLRCANSAHKIGHGHVRKFASEIVIPVLGDVVRAFIVIFVIIIIVVVFVRFFLVVIFLLLITDERSIMALAYEKANFCEGTRRNGGVGAVDLHTGSRSWPARI